MESKNKEVLSFKSSKDFCEFLDNRNPSEKFLFFYEPSKAKGPFCLAKIQSDFSSFDFPSLKVFSNAFSYDLDLFLHVSRTSSIELLGFSIEQNDGSNPGFLDLNNELVGGQKDGLKRVHQQSIGYKDCYREIGIAWMKVETLKKAASSSSQLTDRFLFTDSFFSDCCFVEGIPLPKKTNELIKKTSKKPALFLDRDGIINEDLGYISSKDKVHFIEGVFPLIKLFKEKGWWVFVVTNQSGVARGFFSEENVVSLHKWMDLEMKKRSAEVDGWFFCPFHPKAKDELLKGVSLFRKPNPGMLLSAAEKYGVHLEKSLMIGDKLTDIISLRGLKANLIKGRYPLDGATAPCFKSHDELVNYYLNLED